VDESQWTLPRLLQRALDEFPDTEALVDGEIRWTFRDLVTNVGRAAAAMIADGVRPGDRVAVWAPNGYRWVMAALGAVSAGAVLVPVSTRYKAVLAAHDAVAEAAVIGVPDNRLGEVGRALVVLRPGAKPAAGTLIEFCRERLAGYKVPASVQIVESLPKNAAGKVRKDLLREA
jgi:acyl-CoA synthetase (AMP-forming)/AMP-acid ligase II